MKSFSKIASVILALIMMLTVCVMPTSAASDTELDVTYTVAKDAENSDEEYDVYGVTISVQAGKNNIAMLNIPIIYDLTVFTPSSMKSGHGGAIKYTTKMSGQYKYPAFVGLGEFNAEVEYDFESDGVTVNPDWEGGVSPAGVATLESSVGNTTNLGTLDQSKYGCVYFVFEYADATRYIVAGEKVDLVTFYFFTAAGTDVSGVEFGTIGDATKPAGTFETTGDLYYTGADYAFGDIATVNVTNGSYSVPAIVNPLKGQIRFDKNTDGTYANTFDVRALAVISGEDFEELFTDVDTARANQSIQEAGFVFAAGSNVAAPSMDAVKALVESGTAAAGYTKKTVEFISTSVSAGDYVFSCIVEDIPDADKANSLVAVGYIKYVSGGETLYAYYPAAQTVSYSELFNAHYNTAFGA